jgi:cytochrome c-type biogenesis protein CcmE
LPPLEGGRGGGIKTYTMKKIHILGIIVIAVAIGVIFTSLQSSATYSDFTEAIANPDTEYHVVG